jgi:hypothetical protein
MGGELAQADFVEDEMAAAIEYLCSTLHERRDEGTITIVEGAWAYCGCGAADDHKWQRIPPTGVATLQALSAEAMRDLAERVGRR